MMNNWERIDINIYRRRILRGWFVATFADGRWISVTYVPDEENDWEEGEED